jgi:hypothetical protein
LLIFFHVDLSGVKKHNFNLTCVPTKN